MAQDRSKVAAATAAVVPFHCVVCFDEFSIKERPPVVLPCGHTYICLPCSKRIKRCMECREPLFYSIKSTTLSSSSLSMAQQQQQQSHHHSQQQNPRTPVPFAPNMYGRYSPTTPSTPPQYGATGNNNNSNNNTPSGHMTVHQIPCSIPKNVVLIAMMEAAERQARDKHQQMLLSSSTQQQKPKHTIPKTIEATTGGSEFVEKDIDNEENDDDDDTTRSSTNDDDDDDENSMNASEDDEEYDLNRIISGMATFSGPCGTYAVKAIDGLTVYPTLPIPTINNDDDDEEGDDDDDENDPITDCSSSVRNKLNVTASYDSVEITDPGCATTSPTEIPKISMHLRRGQTVQIVRFENGIATIARNGGFIQANSSQLVKVGGPLEKTCRLEGLLDTVISRGKDLQRELDENNRIEEALRREIETELQVEPIHPVITSIEDDTENCDHLNSSPTTPKASSTRGTNNDEIQQPTLGTPTQGDNVTSPVSSGSVRKSSTDLCQYQIDPFPHSPNENQNTSNNLIVGSSNGDFRAPGLPSYRTRQASSFDDEYYHMQDYGCGAANILGNSAFRLFTTTGMSTGTASTTDVTATAVVNRQLIPHDNSSYEPIVTHTNSYTGNNRYQQQQQINRFRSMSSDAHHHHHHSHELGSASSFDAIDFRTGMSGHRGLNNKSTASKLGSGHHNHYPGHYSPSSHYRSNSAHTNSNRFMMSEHRGIGRVRGPLQKTYNTTP